MINKRENNCIDEESELKQDSYRFTKNRKTMLEHYDKILEDTRLSLEETKKIQDTVEQELERIRYSRKT